MVIQEVFFDLDLAPVLGNREFKGVHFDSRLLSPGDLFLAVATDNNDGHLYVEKALNDKAAGCIVSREFFKKTTLSLKEKLVPYDEMWVFLEKYSRRYLEQIKLVNRIAITGTNGKTTTKEMLYHLLKDSFTCFKSYKNFNNSLGLVYNIFKIPEKTHTAVFEIGTNHPGEIAWLASLINPTHGMVINTGYGHIEFFHSREEIAREKLSLAEHLTRNGTFIVNEDDPVLKAMMIDMNIVPGRRVSSENKNADYFFERNKDGLVLQGRFVPYPRPFFPYGENFAMALSMALELGLAHEELSGRVEGLGGVNSRLATENVREAVVINDTYNSNPDSLLFAFNYLSFRSSAENKRMFFVLGDMLELGGQSEELHRMVGTKINEGLSEGDLVFTFGKDSRFIGDEITKGEYRHFNDKDELVSFLIPKLKKDVILCVKGSRGMKMEEVIEKLREYNG